MGLYFIVPLTPGCMFWGGREEMVEKCASNLYCEKSWLEAAPLNQFQTSTTLLPPPPPQSARPSPSRPLCTGVYGEQVPTPQAPKKALEGLLPTSLFWHHTAEGWIHTRPDKMVASCTCRLLLKGTPLEYTFHCHITMISNVHSNDLEGLSDSEQP